jgi:DNA gyrase subunit A
MSESIARLLTHVELPSVLKKSYLGYAISVIKSRALPDIRDGLKPVNRRILYSMLKIGNDWNKPPKKSARVIGDVLGNYHPHGDSSVYDAMVRMAQSFAMRYPLITGQGNFGSIDGDEAAHYRYTEVRMSQLAHTMLADIEQETVEFSPNYDNSKQEPKVLPTRIPNLIINGSTGIAVGMATNIPPHNLSEVIDACIALSKEPTLSIEQLLTYLPGPDFPTAATIYGTQGILEAYRTGRGRITMRAVTHIERDEKSSKQKIIVTELPYQVNKARLVEKIAELVREKRLEGITGLRDESDKDGMRVVIEIRRGDIPGVMLNKLFAYTALQTHFHVNMVVLKDESPIICDLKQLIEAFLRHRREVITRRTLFELRKARERAHLLEGLAVALANIEEVIELIKSAKDVATAKSELIRRGWALGGVSELLALAESLDPDLSKNRRSGSMSEQYYLSEQQAQAILDLRLHRLTGLEQNKLFEDYKEHLHHIRELLAILNDPDRLQSVLREELLKIKSQFGDERRTRIIEAAFDLQEEDLIPREERVMTISNDGYVKTQSLTSYQAQRRGGKGKLASDMKEEDFIEQLVVANSHDMLVCFSSLGRAYWLKMYQFPQGGRTARGRPIVNLLPLRENEKIHAFLPVSEYQEGRYVFMATAQGVVKKTPLIDFSRPRKDGITAIDLGEEDYLIGVALTDGQQEALLFTDAGKVIRFMETKVRAMGRAARGVRGVKLGEGQHVISLIMAEVGGEVLTVTANGYGKRTPIEEHRLTGRGGQGIVAIKTNERNGKIVAALPVIAKDEVMLITNRANLVRTQVKGIRRTGRASQGVRLIRLEADEHLVAMQRIADEPDASLA